MQRTSLLSLALLSLALPASAQTLCQGFGPQTPRDIASAIGTNTVSFPHAPETSAMNLCDIHTHTNAEHKGPGFSLPGGEGEHGGWKCNGTDSLSAAELATPEGHETFHGVKPGDTIEVHWVYTTCDVDPGPTLGSCFSEACTNPSLRVESQVFLIVNDDSAADFGTFAYDGHMAGGLHQPKSLPSGTGQPVVFLGSTTGPSYTQEVCSPMQVTWSVRPECMKLSYSSVQRWGAKGNVFNEDHSHGVRQLVTAPELLAPIN
ncbi:delta-class carbonic anhydrase [Ruegeria aquimaris]|uniref:Delta-class carbonic anhydrase n=1 Tax=Ruegeria aquimaris TaxID=2984333 RepID=A0ABT3APZ7_9RHOB|nr:delta-class carbonic anhydrase [Ruegeria sp. XHP0148]MCV2890743.1 delta-class carbonic anhydrase [Ruegeria sp. XHP0148]